jgi:hypothetical protein
VEPAGYLVRQFGIVVRFLLAGSPPHNLLAELREIDRTIVALHDADALTRVENSLIELAIRTFAAAEESRATTGDKRSSGARPALANGSLIAMDAFGSRSIVIREVSSLDRRPKAWK